MNNIDLKFKIENNVRHHEAKGFIFAVTNKSEKVILEKKLLAVSKIYGNKAMAVKKDDVVFIYNLDEDKLIGSFKALKDGYYDPLNSLFGVRYPYIVEIESEENQYFELIKASKFFRTLKINWRDIFNKKGIEILKKVLKGELIQKLKTEEELIDRNYRPSIFSTNLWDFPYQSYGETKKGNNKYPGVTPAFVIYNLIYRYTNPGDKVLDPMAGSGTTIDVCLEERRIPMAFDIVPARDDINQGDARNLPLESESVDFIFIDSPYGDNIKYNDHPLNIGNISALDENFYTSIEDVAREMYRVLKKDKYIAWLIGDQWAKGVFVPVGFKVYEILNKFFTPVDIVVVVRRNQASNTPFWQSKAIEHNFYLRGFKYLLIFRKADLTTKRVGSIKWRKYGK